MAPVSIPDVVEATFSSTRKVSAGGGRWTDEPDPTRPPRNVWGMLRAWTTEETLIARQSGVRISHIFYTEDVDADVRRGDVCTVGGFTGTVQSVRRPSQADHHMMVDLEERQT